MRMSAGLAVLLSCSGSILAQPELCLRWVQRSDVGSPGDRRHHAMAYDSDRGVVVLFGGEAGEFLQGTQEYDGAHWRAISIAGVQPSHRAYHSMAYDPDRRQVVLYGGFAGGVFGLDDTWTYQSDSVNGVWTHAAGNASGTGLAGSGMVFSPVERVIVRYGGTATPFGGESGAFAIFDPRTYEWLASTWVDNLAANGPSLYGFGMAFDQRRGLIVIAGGFSGADENDRTDHVWEYRDDLGWRDLGPTLPGRGYPAMAYDSKRGRIVMVGGDGGQGNTPVEYDPDRGWVRLPDFPGFGRAGAAMVYDSKREKMVFMGGAGAGATFSDTWELESIPMTLSLLPPPAGQLLCARDTITIYSQPGDGRSLTYQWFRDGFELPGETHPQLAILPDTVRGEHSFSLKVKDVCGNEFKSPAVELVIHGPPNVFLDPADKFLCPGDSFKLVATTLSTLAPVSFQWYFNGTAIDRATNATLSLLSVQHENTGYYSVVAKNDCGASIGISFPPHLQVGVTIPGQPKSTVTDVCKSASFSVDALGVGTLRFQWRLDGAPLSDNAYFSGATTSNLTVRPCLYAYEGNYDVVVTDDCGSINAVTSRVAKLTIKPGPEWVLRLTNGPSSRAEQAMAYDDERKVTLLFGGGQLHEGKLRTLSDLWEWDGARWIERMSHSSSNGWTYSAATGWQPSYTGQPVARYQHGLAYDNLRRRFVLFGGQTRTPDLSAQQIFLNDTWEWDGAAWHFLTATGPAPRSRPAMAFDRQRGVTVMTGGFVQGGAPDPKPGGVWEWNGVAWQVRVPTNGPSASYSQESGAMVYDAFHRALLFGPSVGEPAGWTFRTWDGTRWTTVFDEFVSQFFQQQYGDMTFDQDRRRAVWFGGIAGPSNTTGFFDGENWEVLTGSPATPSPRYNLAMAYDTNRHATVLFGGETGNQIFNGETWELIALDVPLINEQPLSRALQLGGNATLNVIARGPAGSPLGYRWFKNGQPLTDGGRISGATTAQLRLVSALASDSGEYTVQVTNECGSTISLKAAFTQGAELPALLAVNAAVPIPGGMGNFVSLPGSPSFSRGNLAFFGVGALGQQGIYLMDALKPGPAPIKIADVNTAIPGGVGNFLSFGDLAQPGDPCVDDKNVAFYGTGADGQRGVYASINNALIRVMDTATAIPGGTGNFIAAPTDPCISGENVGFRGEGLGGQQGIYARINGSLVRIADASTAIPGGTGTFTSTPGDPCISGDAVAFLGNGADGQQGIYLSQAGTLSVVVDRQTAIPGGAGQFTSIPTDPCIYGNTVAFVGEGSGGQQGVYVKTPGDPCQFIADRGTPIPGGAGNFTGFGTVSVSETDLAFIGHGAGGQTGIYDYVNDQLVKVVAVGDRLGGKSVVGLNFSKTGLWGDPVSFRAVFEDGSEGIYTIDVAAPSTVRITRLERFGSDLRVSFTSAVGRSYVIQTSSDLQPDSWSDLSGVPISATGSTSQITLNLVSGERHRFFRLKEVP